MISNFKCKNHGASTPPLSGFMLKVHQDFILDILITEPRFLLFTGTLATGHHKYDYPKISNSKSK